jgi:lysine 2,3-aminomutase
MLTTPAQTKQVSEGIGAFEPLGAGKPLKHRQLLDGDFWRKIPAYQHISREVFLDHIWQARNSITRPEQLKDVLQDLLPLEFYRDVALGFHRAPMSMRITPYVLSLIDWSDPYEDPLRRQFITVGSRLLPDHPKLTLDSLHEQADASVPGLTHRYGDRALFISLDTCPVYCRFCTRSYAVGTDTNQIEKVSIKAQSSRWERVFRYISSHPELEDILVSGGDTYMLRPDQIRLIGETLLRFDNVRRIRFATKGPAVMPQKILTDDEWLAALTYIVSLGRKLHKEVALHTHFNHANEITQITKHAFCSAA